MDAQQDSLQRAVEALPLLPDAIVLLKVPAALSCKSVCVSAFFHTGIYSCQYKSHTGIYSCQYKSLVLS